MKTTFSNGGAHMKMYVLLFLVFFAGCSKLDFVLITNECTCSTRFLTRDDIFEEFSAKKIIEVPMIEILLGRDQFIYFVVEQNGVLYRYENKKFDYGDFRERYIDANVWSESRYFLKVNRVGSILIRNKSNEWMPLEQIGFEKRSYLMDKYQYE